MPAGQNLIGAWTTLGTGTVTINATTGSVTIQPAGDNTPTTVRQQITTEIGKRYWFTYELQSSNNTQTWRSIGTTPGAGDILSINTSTIPETKFEFTATTTSIWLDLARTAAGTTITGNFRFEEYPPGGAAARRLNGRSQYFKLDAGAAGLRTSNSLQYIGGWFKFQYVPTSAVYLMDFAIPDAVASGGQQRARIFYDPGNTKIAASSGGSSANGNKYQERWVTASPGADTWHYVGISIAGDGAVTLVYDGTIGGTTTATGIPEVANYLTVLHLGSRNGTTPTLYAPAILADWVWCAGFLPTTAQIQALAAGSRPSDIVGFNPSFYWRLEGTTVAEPSAAGVAELTANIAPANVVGPSYIVPLPADILPLLMF
jgi:hypothetical protein